jgi:hypothetical protein
MSSLLSRKTLALVAIGALLTTRAASAALIIEINPTTPKLATLTIGGTLPDAGPLVNRHLLNLANPFGVAPATLQNSSAFAASTLTVGGVPISVAYDAGGGFNQVPGSPGVPSLYFGSGSFLAFSPGSSAVGTLSLSLPGADTWASPGSVGDVYWGLSGGVLAGTWRIGPAAVTVPEPGTLLLLGAGLFGIALTRGRRAT